MNKPGKRLLARAVENLDNEFLRMAVKNAVDKLDANKNKATDDLGNWDMWRDRGRAIRSHTIEYLDYYLSLLADNVRKAGGNIHFAPTGQDAINIILELTHQHNVKMITKSKSMVAEEISLNKALEHSGIEVVETDLGEYIIQLAGEVPSHIIVPAMHKNRTQIAELFSKVAGSKLSSDTPTLTAFAREVLREKFLNASMGITGCNFAVAESGSISLVTNEGNARFCYSLPKVHISLMGMERIVPTWEDLESILTLLPRAATGQKLTSYLSIVNGPRRPGETDGAEEFHLIVVDNGRSSILGDPEVREILNCTRCGACYNVCPVYRQMGGHAYGSVYGGPIGAALTPLLTGDYDFWGELPFASSLCGACSEICSVKIPIHEILTLLRHRKIQKGFTPTAEKLIFKSWRRFWRKPSTYRISMKSAAIFQRPFTSNGMIKRGPTPLSAWTNSRYFPALAKESFRDRWRKG